MKIDWGKIKELRGHLADMHEEWVRRCKTGEDDGYHKSSEGLVEVHLCYPNWFEDDYRNAEPKVLVSVYSYLFGPSRMHDFDSLDEALTAVKEWKESYFTSPIETEI